MTDDAQNAVMTNRTWWDSVVQTHVGSDFYAVDDLLAGRARLNAIEEDELGAVRGLKTLHLQCHFGRDSLIMAGQGAQVTGVDFSGPAIEAAQSLAGRMGLSDRTRFIQSSVYDAPGAVPDYGRYDLVFVSWGALIWLPDIRKWADVVAGALKPGGRLYVADAHPTALVFDSPQDAVNAEAFPVTSVPYFDRGPHVEEVTPDYADPSFEPPQPTTYSFQHTLADIVTSVIEAGLTVHWLHEHKE